MASYLCLLFLAITVSVTISSARFIPAEPVSVMLDAYGNPIVFLREKRAPVRQVMPHRAMMFTGYYRPARRSDDGDQATGVFAQGNSVSGGSYFGGAPQTHLKNGPEPIDEPEISSAQAEAAPEPEDAHHEYQQDDHQVQEQSDPGFTGEEQHETPISDPEPVSYDIDAPAPAAVEENPEAPAAEEAAQLPDPEAPSVLIKPPPVKKGKKTPIPVDDDEEDEDEDEDETPYVPFLPGKGNRRQGGYVPNLNNLFPMMFNFPGLSRQAGSSGSPPGLVTAIANSYSTGKSGVASSVATAYGGSPTGKKARRTPAVADE